MTTETTRALLDSTARNLRSWLRGFCCLCCLSCFSCLLFSCSEENTTEEEFANWQERNDAAVASWASNSAYRKILCYSKESSSTTLVNSDYIYVEVLEEGSGTECPLFTDTVRVAYRGSLIPTTSYPDGYVFDQTYTGAFNWSTAGVTDFCPSTSGLRDGFSTALQNMHVGDRWRVHFSYTLGYGSTANSGIPAYSDLIFEIAVFDHWHPGEVRPAFKVR